MEKLYQVISTTGYPSYRCNTIGVYKTRVEAEFIKSQKRITFGSGSICNLGCGYNTIEIKVIELDVQSIDKTTKEFKKFIPEYMKTLNSELEKRNGCAIEDLNEVSRIKKEIESLLK